MFAYVTMLWSLFLCRKWIFRQNRTLYVKDSVVIGNNVWIGRNVCIMPGVTIGESAVVGANAVVTCNVPPKTIFGGGQLKKYEKIEQNCVKESGSNFHLQRNAIYPSY